ncbi:hypothetical protein FACS1894151_08960 [Spirochaetia bacterium]|nr:hypothetical protein FACS1894151_08960 [Spirochaetia bacterium]
MNKRWKVMMIAFITIIAFSVLPLFGQGLPSPRSNTAAATNDNFTTDVDDYLDVHNYGNVLEGSNWFGFGGITPVTINNVPNVGLDLGYARNFGGLYFGAYYNGLIVTEGDVLTTTNEYTDYANTNGVYQKTGSGTTVENGLTGQNKFLLPRGYNNVDLLFGIAGMGIKVGFYEQLRFTDKYVTAPGAVVGNSTGTEQDIYGNTTTTDKVDYSYVNGWLIPKLGWGMSLSLGGITIKPIVDVAFGIYQNSTSYSDTPNNVTDNGTYIDTKTNTENYSNYGYLQPVIAIGADIDFAPKGIGSFGVGLTYNIGFGIYGHSYKDAFGSQNTDGSVYAENATYEAVDASTKTVTDYSFVIITDSSNIYHTIQPGFWYSAELSDTVSLGINYNLAFHINSKSFDQAETISTITRTSFHNGAYGSRTESVRTNDLEAGYEESVFGINSSIGTGLSWKAKERLTINAGIGIYLPSYSITTRVTHPQDVDVEKFYTYNDDGSKGTPETTIYNADRAENVSQVTTTEENWTKLGANFTLGGNFAFTPNFGVDLLLTNVVSFGAGSSGVNDVVLDLTKLQFSLLATLKF